MRNSAAAGLNLRRHLTSIEARDLRGPNCRDPVKWVEHWPVSDLSNKDRDKIKAQLLKADSEFWKSPDADSTDSAAMKLAFDGIAKVLFEAGILTEHLLHNEIPALVWDSAIAGGWYRFASDTAKTNLSRAARALLGMAGGEQGLESVVPPRDRGVAGLFAREPKRKWNWPLQLQSHRSHTKIWRL